MSVGGATRVLAILGDPVSHSLSPAFQNAAIRAEGLDAVYVALRCFRDRLPALMRALIEAGGGGNVTLPLKEAAATVLDDPTEAVLRTGACNTFWAREGRLAGDNTDLEGFRRAAEELVGSLEGRRVLLLGAGGAARAALAALLAGNAGPVTVLNRTPDRARRMVEELTPGDAPVLVLEGAGELPSLPAPDLVVNATRLGIRPDDPSPLGPDAVAGAGAVLDLVYAAGRPTPLVEVASRVGVHAADGSRMLLFQGAVAFERWFGRTAPLAAMDRALRRAGAG